MIHLVNVDGDRHVYRCDQDPCEHPDPVDGTESASSRGLRESDLLGWIEKGRTRGNRTEWRFTPAAPDSPAGKIHWNYSAAYTDARTYARN